MPEQVRIGWRPYVPTTYPTDTDASAFINIAGITNTNQQTAINTLVNELKLYGIWNKMKAIYPFVGGSAASHKFNLKDPRDLDAAFRLTFSGGWTHTSTGALPNGSNGYAETYFNNSKFASTLKASAGYYSRTNRDKLGTSLAGWQDGVSNVSIFANYGGKAYFSLNDPSSGVITANTNYITVTDSLGFYQVARNDSNTQLIIAKNSYTQTGNATVGNTNIVTIKLGAGSNIHGLWGPDNLELSFAYFGDDLSATELGNYYLAVQKFQTILNRHTGSPIMPAGQVSTLLDTYSGVAAAFSTRKIRGSYTGSAIRVRRSSDNTEQDIAFDSNGELNTAQLLTFTGTSNGFVTKWYDQSGNGRDMAQTTAANQPQISMNGVVFTEKGRPTITSTGACVMSMNGTIPVSTAISSFILLRPNIVRSNFGMFLGFIGGAHLSPSRNGTGNNRYYGTPDLVYTPLPNTNNYITITNNSNKVDVWENGTQIMNTVNSASDSVLASTGINLFDRWLNSGPLTLGTSLSEVIVYNSDQRTNRTGIESNMNSYFNLSYTDSDAQSFITNAGITDSVQQTALIGLVKMLKSEGLWTKMKAIYPFIGGSAASHKWNLKDPRDANDAFRLTFYGGLSHDGGGVYFNGSNSWCDTNMNAATNLNVDNLHLSFYSRTNSNNVYSGGEIGHVGYNNWTTPPQDPLKQFTLRVRSAQYGGGAQFSSGNLHTTYSTIDGFGLTIGSITNSSTAKMYKGRNTQEFANKANATGSNTGSLPSFNISIGKIQGYGEWSNQQAAFVSIGDGLTDTESAKLYGIVQIYQITLGRSV